MEFSTLCSAVFTPVQDSMRERVSIHNLFLVFNALNGGEMAWISSHPNPVPQVLFRGFSAGWGSSICEIKVHYPVIVTQTGPKAS